MSWFFKQAEDLAPELAPSEEPTIVETAYTGCAWCGDGDGNGICLACEAAYFPRHTAQG